MQVSGLAPVSVSGYSAPQLCLRWFHRLGDAICWETHYIPNLRHHHPQWGQEVQREPVRFTGKKSTGLRNCTTLMWPESDPLLLAWVANRFQRNGTDVRWGCVGKGSARWSKGFVANPHCVRHLRAGFIILRYSQFRTGPLCEVWIFSNTPCIHPYPVIWGGVQLQILEAWWPWWRWWPWLTITIKVPLRLPIWHWPLLKFDPSWFIAAFRRIPWTQRRTICSNRRLLFIIPAWHVEPSSAMFNLHTIRGI